MKKISRCGILCATKEHYSAFNKRKREHMREQKTDYLIRQVAVGNMDAAAQLYEQVKKGVYAFVYPYFNNRWDTEDCLQSAFLKICRNAQSYKPHTDARAWIFQIAKNTALDMLRQKSREKVTDTLPERSSGLQDGTVFDAMQRVLSEEENRIVVLHVLWGYKHREIAALLNCPVGTVTSKYKRAAEKLRQFLREK